MIVQKSYPVDDEMMYPTPILQKPVYIAPSGIMTEVKPETIVREPYLNILSNTSDIYNVSPSPNIPLEPIDNTGIVEPVPVIEPISAPITEIIPIDPVEVQARFDIAKQLIPEVAMNLPTAEIEKVIEQKQVESIAIIQEIHPEITKEEIQNITGDNTLQLVQLAEAVKLEPELPITEVNEVVTKVTEEKILQAKEEIKNTEVKTEVKQKPLSYLDRLVNYIYSQLYTN